MVQILALALMFTNASHAQTTSAKFKVRQIIHAQNQVVVSSTEEVPFAPGKNFVATLNDGAQCTLTLSQIDKKTLTLDSSPCAEVKQITLKTPIEPALVTNTTKAATPGAATTPEVIDNDSQSKNNDSRNDTGKTIWGGRFGVILSGSYSGDLRFRNSEYRVGNARYDFDMDINYDQKFAPGIGISYSKMKEQAWGFSGSLYYEFARELKSFQLSQSGNTFNFTGKPKLSFALLEANIVYRWDRIYTPFGLNLSLPFLSDDDGITARPSIGLYGAVGVMLTDDAALEFYLRAIGINMKATNAGEELDFGAGYQGALGMSARYWF